MLADMDLAAIKARWPKRPISPYWADSSDAQEEDVWALVAAIERVLERAERYDACGLEWGPVVASAIRAAVNGSAPADSGNITGMTATVTLCDYCADGAGRRMPGTCAGPPCANAMPWVNCAKQDHCVLTCGHEGECRDLPF